MTMTIEDPTPEAQEFVDSIVCRTIGRDVALALDAWGAALLKRREDAPGPDAPGTHEGCTAKEWYDRASRTWQTLLAEKAAHAVTRSSLEFLEGYRSVVEPELEALKAERVKSDEQIEALVRQRNLIQMRQDALRGELDATRKELSVAIELKVDYWEKLLAKRAKCDAVTAERDRLKNEYQAIEWGSRSNTQAFEKKLALVETELESLRKPLEGELAEDVAIIQRALSDATLRAADAFVRIKAALRAKGAFDIAHLEHGCAEAFVSLEAKARGGETLAVHQSEWLSAEAARLRAKGEPQAAEPPEPRPIVVGSKWRHGEFECVVTAYCDGKPWLRFASSDGEVYDMSERRFRAHHTWFRDPPATPAPELPRKVEPGSTLQVGARYRITEVASWDKSAEHAPGDELLCSNDDCTGTLEPVWQAWGDSYKPASWFAHSIYSGTYVTGLELVAEAPAKEQP